MPIKIQNDLPAKAVLESENIFIMDESRALTQEIRPLEIAILNLMPVKEDYETQLLRALSNTPLQLEITFVKLSSHESKNTSAVHLNKFYIPFEDIKKRKFDGMIITGAPVEHMEYEEVTYWDEIMSIMEWTKTNVTSTFHICWGALAGLFYHHGIKKYPTDQKCSGIYKHRVLDRRSPLIRSFDDIFYAPHSRNSTILREDIEACPELKLLAVSDEAGVCLAESLDAKQVYVLGHPEYDRVTLDNEYRRDLAKYDDVIKPANYYTDENPDITPLLTWRCHANTLYTNWLNYYVYQITPFDLENGK